MKNIKLSVAYTALPALLLLGCTVESGDPRGAMPPPPPPTERQFLNTGEKPNGYTHTVAVSSPGTMVFVSGAAGRGPDGMPEDFKTQCENTFKSLEARLALAGADFDDVVKVTYFMSPDADMAVLREVRSRYLNMENPPAASAIPASFKAPMMLEVEAIAVLDRTGPR